MITWGAIGAGGELLYGSGGYSVTSPETGHYLITWSTAKASADYAVLATAASEAPKLVARARKVSAASFEVSLWHAEGTEDAGANSAFSFIVLSAT